jgi:hypothetical protein
LWSGAGEPSGSKSEAEMPLLCEDSPDVEYNAGNGFETRRCGLLQVLNCFGLRIKENMR